MLLLLSGWPPEVFAMLSLSEVIRMLVLSFECLLSLGDWSGGGGEHNSGWLNFAKKRRGKEDSEAEKEDMKQSISRGIMDGNYKNTWH